MTIHQLPKPCFTLDPSPWDDDHGTPHYGTWAEADKALREKREELGPDPADLASIETTRVKQRGAACWIAECDAPRRARGHLRRDARRRGGRPGLRPLRVA